MADLFDIVTARKLSGGGGGGSSDFSTATVTVVNNDAYNTAEGTAVGVIYDSSPEWDLPLGTLPICTGTYFFSIAPHESATYLVCLYKGHTILSVLGNINVSGDAELIDSENSIYDITGDCTITIS